MPMGMRFRRMLAILVAVLLAAAAAAAPAAAQDGNNSATAVNQEDGSTEVEISFDVEKVLDGIINQTNTAEAYASCQECQTIAIAIQVVLASGPVDNVAVPINTAEALNVECTACLTVAFAYQFVFANGERVQFTREARRRLAALARAFRKLERRADKGKISAQDVLDELDVLMDELSDVLANGIEPIGPRQGRGRVDSTGEQPITDQESDSDGVEAPPEPSPSDTPSSAGPAPFEAPSSAGPAPFEAPEGETPAPETTPTTPTPTPTPTPSSEATATPSATAGTATPQPSPAAEASPSSTR